MQVNKNAIEMTDLYAGGLITVDFIILQDFIPLSTLDLAELLTIFSFSIALPILVGMLILNAIEKRYPYGSPHSRVAIMVHVLYFLGVFANLIGICIVIWHLSWIAGLTLIAVSLLCVVIYGPYIAKLDEHPRQIEIEKGEE